MPDVVPFDESLMPATEPEKLGDIVLDERHLAYAAQRWSDKSASMQRYRMRQAIWARIQHSKPHPDDPTRSRLGGVQPGSGRKPTLRLGQAMVEAAQNRQREIVDAAFSALKPGLDEGLRHKAAMNIARLEREERQLEIVEDEYSRRTDDDVKRDFASRLADMIRKGDLSMDDIQDLAKAKQDVTDAEVVEPAQIEA